MANGDDFSIEEFQEKINHSKRFAELSRGARNLND